MKKILSLLICLMLSLTVVSCGDNKEEVKEPEKEPVVEQPVSKVDKFKNTLKEKGYEVGEDELLAFEMVGANNGYKFKVDGELIEIYEYDEANLSEEGKGFIEQGKNGSISLSGFNVPVKYNNFLMLGRADKHSKGTEIIEIFNSL
ncbi:MAG: hypothetical protein RR620_12015 [Clostridium sp.]